MTSPALPPLEHANRAKTEFEAALQVASEFLSAELIAIELRLTSPEEAAARARDTIAAMERFKLACAAACTAFNEQTTQLVISLRAKETLNFLS